MVDDVPANILPGINRAFASARHVTAKGVDLQGAQQELIVRVCEVGPFLAMKRWNPPRRVAAEAPTTV